MNYSGSAHVGIEPDLTVVVVFRNMKHTNVGFPVVSILNGP